MRLRESRKSFERDIEPDEFLRPPNRQPQTLGDVVGKAGMSKSDMTVEIAEAPQAPAERTIERRALSEFGSCAGLNVVN